MFAVAILQHDWVVIPHFLLTRLQKGSDLIASRLGIERIVMMLWGKMKGIRNISDLAAQYQGGEGSCKKVSLTYLYQSHRVHTPE